MSALQSDNVACLTSTHECMVPAEQREYNKLVDFLKPDSNYSAYRKALSKDNSSGCIPWHGTRF
jgi:RasGEF domain